MSRAGQDWNSRANELAEAAIAAGEPTAWFDRLYAGGVAGETSMPWDRDAGNAQLVAWWETEGSVLPAARAVVVGCGLGADAEMVAREGWRTTGFDLSPTAIEQARARNPASSVDYRVADLLDLPGDLVGAFDLVVEVFTVQALPDPPRAAAARAIASLLAPGGTLVAVAFRGDEEEAAATTYPPFPLTERDLDLLAVDGVRRVRADVVADGARWLAVYRRD